ncbi:hypothetical protein [Vibrio diabolicus]|uniref:hypothetical protein n=1 Tax=Vibrio diabolicus TaxID=50719 RepID=UPI00211B63BE|nr:hypothetical protein [Vibrio diabolicus]
MQKGSPIEFYQHRPQSRETVGVEEVQQQTQQFGFAEPEMDELLKYSLRTQLEAMLQNQLSTAERQRATESRGSVGQLSGYGRGQRS